MKLSIGSTLSLAVCFSVKTQVSPTNHVKYLWRKVDNEKLETILDRYRDDTIKNLGMEIIQLKDAEQEKRWYESYVMKGLDLGTWNDEKHQPQIPYG